VLAILAGTGWLAFSR